VYEDRRNGMIESALWQPAEFALRSAVLRDGPTPTTDLRATFTSASGQERRVYGFWDGEDTWRVRFAPTEEGAWRGVTRCSDRADSGLHHQVLELRAGPPSGGTAFERHGPIRVAGDGRHLEHLDGTPFLWLADTCWNGPLRSDDAEWQAYLRTRSEQSFSVVQWVATQYVAATDGDRDGRMAFTGTDRIAIDPAFFRRLDGKVRALARTGLLGVPVLLWAAEWSDPAVNLTNPGYRLAEDQATLLARHMVARWDSYPVAWFLAGDGPYTGAKAARWQRIGRSVFGDVDHAPVTLHPNGMDWYGPDFDREDWLDFIGYQSGHGDDAATVRWLTEGPPASDWQSLRPRPVVNLEPPYEDHIGYQSGRRFTAADVRKRLAWSLLASPTAGVTYGGHGVWGWDDGSAPPENHPTTGVPRPWREALHLPGSDQIVHLAQLFASIEWWRLVPAPDLVADQPGGHRHISASRSEEGDLALVYVPEDRRLLLDPGSLLPGLVGTWMNAETGETVVATPLEGELITPAPGDWWLTLVSPT
jgi:hypothetical protein